MFQNNILKCILKKKPVKSRILHHPPLKTSLVPETKESMENPFRLESFTISWKIFLVFESFPYLMENPFRLANLLQSFEISFKPISKFIFNGNKFRMGLSRTSNTCTLRLIHRSVIHPFGYHPPQKQTTLSYQDIYAACFIYAVST